jgi:hypothetical protein
MRYHRSRFFTFLFFMQKISGNSLNKFNKSCSTFHQESRKMEFAFFRFFYDSLKVLQESAIWLYYWRCTFTPRPLELFEVSQTSPWKEKEPCNWVLGSSHRRSGLDFGEAAPGLGRRTAGRWLEAHLRHNRWRRRERSGAGGLGRQCWAAPAAAAWLPVRRRHRWRKA